MKIKKKEKGFTLIELIVVVLIIGILAAIALPQYQKAVERSRATEGIILTKSIASANELYRLTHGDYTKNILDLDLHFPGEDYIDTHNSKKTSAFYLRADSSGNLADNIYIAVARRKTKPYFFCVFPYEQAVYCGFDNDEGENLCKQFSDTRHNSRGWYLVR